MLLDDSPRHATCLAVTLYIAGTFLTTFSW